MLWAGDGSVLSILQSTAAPLHLLCKTPPGNHSAECPLPETLLRASGKGRKCRKVEEEKQAFLEGPGRGRPRELMGRAPPQSPQGCNCVPLPLGGSSEPPGAPLRPDAPPASPSRSPQRAGTARHGEGGTGSLSSERFSLLFEPADTWGDTGKKL